MKGDPPSEDGRAVKAAASAWIGSTVAHKDKTDDPEAAAAVKSDQTETEGVKEDAKVNIYLA